MQRRLAIGEEAKAKEMVVRSDSETERRSRSGRLFERCVTGAEVRELAQDRGEGGGG